MFLARNEIFLLSFILKIVIELFVYYFITIFILSNMQKYIL